MAIKMNCNANILDGMLNMDVVIPSNTDKINKKVEPASTIKQNADTVAPVYNETLFTKSMARRKGRGVSIMTPEASEISDATREISKSQKYSGSIHKPRGNNYDGS